MNIGIDAKWFYDGNPSGRTIIRNLLQPLTTIGKKYTFYIFLKKKDSNLDFPIKGSNIRIVYIPSTTNMITNFFIMPLFTFIYKIDVCVFQYFSPLLSRGKRIVFIYDVIFHDRPDFFTKRELLYFKPMRMMARRAHLLCTDSFNERLRLIKYGYNKPEQTDVVYLGKAEHFRPIDYFDSSEVRNVQSRYKLPNRFLLYIGRLNERKNIRTLIRALALLEDKDISLVIAGSQDWKMSPLAEEIVKCGVGNRIVQTGYISDTDLPIVYACASIFCYVSYDEGFGLPPLEAMAAGVPVVVANAGSLPEICSAAGNYVDPHNPTSVAAMIDNLLTDEELRTKKKAEGIERAKFFTWNKTAQKLMTLLEKNTLVK